MLDENSLTGEFVQQLAEDRRNKTHVDTCEITEKYQHQVITIQKAFQITMYNVVQLTWLEHTTKSHWECSSRTQHKIIMQSKVGKNPF